MQKIGDDLHVVRIRVRLIAEFLVFLEPCMHTLHSTYSNNEIVALHALLLSIYLNCILKDW